ncbi:hypothetical protein H0H87_012483 [Tephrocybe sp. NHM501043]|nr:hypothetical protein H0H87_012483 [Tephrocybe sp. NHM501043]
MPAARQKTSTTRLPQSLQEELDEVSGGRTYSLYSLGNNTISGNDHPRTKSKFRPKITRKEARKEERLNRKKHKAEYFSAGQVHNKRRAEEDHEQSPQRKKAKRDQPNVAVTLAPSLKHKSPKAVAKPTIDAKPLPTKKTTALEKLATKSSAPRIPDRKADEEDAYISYLEAKLGYTKGEKRKKPSDDDGLDDLLDFADTLVDPLAGGGDDEEIGDEDDNDLNEEEEDLESQPSGSESGSEGYEDDEWRGLDDDADGNEEEEDVASDAPELLPPQETATRYFPPHLRNKELANEKPSESMLRLSRQLKGLLNRMSEQNMSSILDNIEAIYRENRRNDVTTSLTTLIINGISSHSSLLDSYVVMYAAFVSSLHKIVGIEFAAYFVQNVVSSYERHFGALQTAPMEEEDSGKECSNLIVLLSELYNFQVISSVLVFDIIRGLLDAGLSEFGVELLLKIVRNSGLQLRQDDPTALKDIIQIVQNKVLEKDDAALSSRTKFMIETLINLKNNKSKRSATQNQGADSVERMKKFLSGLSKKRTVLAHEPLRVSLQDLHSAGTKGKWWLVGAAWGGDPLVDHQTEVKAIKVAEATDPAGDLIQLARKQGMNTDIRRSIFVVLMSSDDYVDACERLSQLNLTEVQQREIVRVLLHCCGNERSYNPYYTLVCQQLCRISHSYRITLQFSLWDFLRDLGETSVGGTKLIKNLKEEDGFDIKSISTTRIRNVARAYGWWIANDCVTLAILKPVDFTSLKKTTTEFLTEMLMQVFICSQRSTPLITSDVPTSRNRSAIEEIFIKATRIQALAMGLVYFISGAFRDLSKDSDDMGKLIKWASGLAKDTLRTGVDIVPGL